MAIVQTVNADMFIREFDEMDRSDNFSTEARYALFDYYDGLSEDAGEDFQLDIIAICCDWSELTIDNAINECSHLLDEDELAECEDDDDKMDYVESVLNDNTFVIRLDDTLLIQVF